jgi:hypothetical protein
MGRTKDLIIDLRSAPGGEGLAGIGLTADPGRVLARPGPVALTALLWDIALLIVDVGRVRVAGRDPAGRAAAGRSGVLADVPVIARARAGRRGR